jgi:hypothetical protein
MSHNEHTSSMIPAGLSSKSVFFFLHCSRDLMLPKRWGAAYLIPAASVTARDSPFRFSTQLSPT